MLLTVGEIAKQLKVEKRTVASWIRRGQLKAYKIGRAYRIDSTDYDKFLKERVTLELL